MGVINGHWEHMTPGMTGIGSQRHLELDRSLAKTLFYGGAEGVIDGED